MSKVTVTDSMRLLLRDDQPVAERLSNVADRYAFIIAHQTLPFNDLELLAIVTANWSSATELSHPERLINTITSNVVDSLSFDELSMWENKDQLIELPQKINALTITQKIALIELIENRKNAAL